MPDVERLETATRELRAADYQHGGGTCHDAVVAQLPVAHGLLEAPGPDDVTGRLATAVADLHNLAGWICFDIGLVGSALAHFRNALRLAEWNANKNLAANVHYRVGRVHLHYHNPREALNQFCRGEDAAVAAGSRHGVAIMYANQAWAYAKLGLAGEALALLGRSHDEFDRVDAARAPGWAAFFDETDLAAMAGTVYGELALTKDARFTRSAIPSLSLAIAGYAEDMTRSKAFNLIALATCHLLDGDIDRGVQVGAEAVELCAQVASVRTLDRLRPLKNTIALRRGDPGIGELRRRIHALR